jgi:nucleotide-binding universal stress UspA family protein
MITKILVPVDGSAFAESAIPLALSFAAKSGAEVRLGMVSAPANLPPGVWAEAFLDNHSRYLDAATEEVVEQAGPGTTVSSVLLEGEVSGALCEEVTSSKVDLVVMSTHGHGGLTRMWLGSVADALLRESPVPVVLVRPTENEAGEPVAQESIAGIIVPLDGSRFAEHAIEPALLVGHLFGVPITLLRAVSYPVMISSYLPDTAEQNQAFIRQAEDEARDYLDLVRSRYAHESPPIELEVLVSPRPASGVLDFVSKSGADFVVMASHARRGIARAALGSIADKVIRGSKTPIMVVHPSDEKRHARSEEVA